MIRAACHIRRLTRAYPGPQQSLPPLRQIARVYTMRCTEIVPGLNQTTVPCPRLSHVPVHIALPCFPQFLTRHLHPLPPAAYANPPRQPAADAPSRDSTSSTSSTSSPVPLPLFSSIQIHRSPSFLARPDTTRILDFAFASTHRSILQVRHSSLDFRHPLNPFDGRF